MQRAVGQLCARPHEGKQRAIDGDAKAGFRVRYRVHFRKNSLAALMLLARANPNAIT